MASLLRSHRAWVLALLACLAGLALWQWVTGPPVDGRSRAILRGATRVEVYRIDGRNGDERVPPKPGERAIGGFRVIARGEDRGPEFAARLADVLLDRATYSSTYNKCYWPGVVFRACKGQECVDVMVCFQCDNFYVGPPSKVEVRETASFYDTPAVPRLVRLAKEAFPDDKDIQALKEDRE
jgi:hypothetical protein